MTVNLQSASIPQPVLLTTYWDESEENSVLDLQSLANGGRLETIETMKKCETRYSYQVDCEPIVETKEGWELTLRYTRENNPHLKEYWSEDIWGTVVVNIGREFANTVVHFTPEGKKPYKAKCNARFALWADLRSGWAKILLRQGQQKLRLALLKDGCQCAITGETTESVLEAAHLLPHADSGSAEPCNAILLRADIHKLFDQGYFDISADGKVVFEKPFPASSLYVQEVSTWEIRLQKVVPRIAAALKERAARKAREVKDSIP